MTDFYDVLPIIPEDLRPIIHQLYDKATDATWSVEEVITTAAEKLAKSKGNPAALQHGESIIREKVTAQIAQAKTQLQEGLDGFNSSGAWQGSGASAFFDYVPRLLAAIGTLEANTAFVADAVAAFRTGLMDTWASVISTTTKALADTIGALGSKEKVELVTNIIHAWASWVSDIVTTYLKLDEQKYQAKDKLGQVTTDGLVKVKVSSNEHYSGPVGYQLPMPTDVSLNPDWSRAQVRARWELQPRGSVQLLMEPYRAFVRHLRDNGTYWRAACRNQVDAWLAMPPSAFSIVGGDFYASLSAVMAQDYITYFYSDRRLSQLANLLDEVGAAYGQTDADSAELFRDYLANE